MKPKLFLSFAAAFAAAVTFHDVATADWRPTVSSIEPGPGMALDQKALGILKAAGDNIAPLAELMRHGNSITSATIELIAPEATVYRITVQQCSMSRVGPICTGGATLTISKIGANIGGVVRTSYQTSIVLLR